MGIIANWTAISNKGITVSNITDYTQCPSKSDIIMNTTAFIQNNSNYLIDQLVQLDDVLNQSLLTLVNYLAYGANKFEAWDGDSPGTLYELDGVYYADPYGSIRAEIGYYCTKKGDLIPPDYPDYPDSEFIIIT